MSFNRDHWSVTRIESLMSRIPPAWEIFLYVFLIFYFIPSLLVSFNLERNIFLPEMVDLFLSGYYISPSVSQDFLIASFIFLFAYLLPLLYWSLIRNLPVFNNKKAKKLRIDWLLKNSFSTRNTISSLLIQIIYVSSFIAVFVVLIYFFFVGINFLAQLGSDLSAADFRFYLYEDDYQIYNYLLEIARRILLPIVVTFFMFMSFMRNGKLSTRDKLLWLILLLSGIMTLDRGPIFLAVALLIIYSMFRGSNLFLGTLKTLFWLACLVFIGGLITSLQYNVTDLDFKYIYETGIAVLVNRLFYDPSLMSLTYSFVQVDGNTNPLLLNFSRISVLWGNAYVGSLSENSIYVAPVSIVGDIWRNFGNIGMMLFPFLLSILLLIISKGQEKASIFFQFPIMFLSVILSFYLVVGNLFSIGPLLILMIILILTNLVKVKTN